MTIQRERGERYGGPLFESSPKQASPTSRETEQIAMSQGSFVQTLAIAVGLALSVAACGGETASCTPNATRACLCGTRMGAQACTASGLAYTPCVCDEPDSGVPPVDVQMPPSDVQMPPTDVQIPPTDMPTPPVDVLMPPPDACASGPENTAAACSDGCSNDGDTYVDCNDFDCCNVVRCGPTTSCGRRAMCTGCAGGTACGTGLTCARRSCDLRQGCYPADPLASCDTIDGVACPPTAAYDRCTGATDCGSLATCAIGGTPGYGWTVARCNPTLGCQGMAGPGCSFYGANPCPPVPSTFTGVTSACAVTGDSFRGPCYGCVLQCTAGATCPYGLRCVSGRCID